MFDGLLILVDIIAATASIRYLARLDRLGRECRAYAQRESGNGKDSLLALVGDQNLDKHQKIMRMESLAAGMGLLLSFSCLMGVVIITW
ncbi:MAG: hypothetical protein ACR2RF_13060 [Geminicoccaceae bacterium]